MVMKLTLDSNVSDWLAERRLSFCDEQNVAHRSPLFRDRVSIGNCIFPALHDMRDLPSTIDPLKPHAIWTSRPVIVMRRGSQPQIRHLYIYCDAPN